MIPDLFIADVDRKSKPRASGDDPAWIDSQGSDGW